MSCKLIIVSSVTSNEIQLKEKFTPISQKYSFRLYKLSHAFKLDSSIHLIHIIYLSTYIHIE